jgi:acetyl-CoA synthetase
LTGIDWSATSYAEVRARHRWSVPEILNIGVSASDRHAATGRTALIEALPDGVLRTHSFAELSRLSDHLASGLRAIGVEPRDRVAVLLGQRLETVVAHLAVLKLGAVSVPLSPLFGEDALEYRLGHSGTKVLVTGREHATVVAALRSRLGDLRVVVACDPEAWTGADVCFERIVSGTPGAFTPAPTRADDPAMIVYTSGTTRKPLGALHAHRFLPGRLPGFELIHRLEGGPHEYRPFWTPADWAWVGGLVDSVLTPLFFGRPVLASSRTGRFEPEAAFELMARARVRSLFLPPTALNILSRVAEARERYGLAVFSTHSAGEPLHPATLAWAEQTFGTVFELYGMTEMGATIGNSPFSPVRPGSMGKPYPGHVVSIADEAGDHLPDDQLGEIVVRRDDPGMFLGYWNDAAATASRFRGDSLATGDLARRDAEGYFWYVGRADDVFKTSGYRVAPGEIEAAIEGWAGVERAGVVGVPDPERGTIVKAFVLLKHDVLPTASVACSIQEHVRARLAAYQYPRRVVFVRELPLTVTGKLRRSELRSPDADQRFGVDAEK